MDIDTAPETADVHEHGGGVADTGNGLIDVPLVFYGHIGDGAPLLGKGVGKAEKVTDHQVGKPVFLQLREAVRDIKGPWRLPAYNPVHLHGKGLKAHAGIKAVFFYIGPAPGQGLRVNNLLMVPKAQVNDPLSAESGVGDKFCGYKGVVSDIFYLPGHGVARAEKVQRKVKPLKAGAYTSFIVHGRASFNNDSLYTMKSASRNRRKPVKLA